MYLKCPKQEPEDSDKGQDYVELLIIGGGKRSKGVAHGLVYVPVVHGAVLAVPGFGVRGDRVIWNEYPSPGSRSAELKMNPRSRVALVFQVDFEFLHQVQVKKNPGP